MTPAATQDSSTLLLFWAAVTIAGLVVLIGRCRWHPFIALTAGSLFLGLVSGLDGLTAAQAFGEGVGAMLANVTLAVGLGTILGHLLAISGGAAVLSEAFVNWFGPKRLPWAVLCIGLVVGIPTWFTVGLVLTLPIVLSLASKVNQPVLGLGVPLMAGLSAAHGLIPPHPGPMAAIGLLHADMGKTILWGLVTAIPAAILAGPCFARWVAPRITLGSRLGVMSVRSTPDVARPPSIAITLATILLPVALMMGATAVEVLGWATTPAGRVLRFLGHPTVAMLAAVGFAMYSFGYARGLSNASLLRATEECLGPVAAVLLIVGAGGGFNKVLMVSGIGQAIASTAAHLDLSPLVFGWLVAALIRIATGSATVGITTGASLAAPVAAAIPGTSPELLVIATGAGSLILSHLNDGGFWFVKEYFGLNVAQTLQSWTVLETILAFSGLGIVLLLDRFVT